MTTTILVLLSLLTATLAEAQQSSLVLLDSTPVRMRIARNVSSADAQVGETVDFEVLDPIVVEGRVVVPRSGVAFGTITEAKSRGRMGKSGKLNVNIDSVRLADGQKVPLRAVKEVKADGRGGVVTGAVVASAIVFFPAAPLFLLMKGKDITIPKGTEITAYVNGEVRLDPAKYKESQ